MTRSLTNDSNPNLIRSEDSDAGKQKVTHKSTLESLFEEPGEFPGESNYLVPAPDPESGNGIRDRIYPNTAGSSLGRYVFGSEISYNKPPPRLPGLAC